MENPNLFKMTRYALGLTAMIMAMLFIYRYPTNVFILAASGYLFIICGTDTLYSKIPNLVTLPLMLIGITYNIVISGLPGIVFSAAGLTVGLALLIVPFMMGGMGAGDVKALAALGTLLGPGKIFQIFLYMGIIGGLLGLMFHLMSSDTRKELRHYAAALKSVYLTKDYKSFKNPKIRKTYKFPYASAIAFGFFAFTFWGDIL
ncbi:MAG: prepilin peptidase [Pedobacter sp.]